MPILVSGYQYQDWETSEGIGILYQYQCQNGYIRITVLILHPNIGIGIPTLGYLYWYWNATNIGILVFILEHKNWYRDTCIDIGILASILGCQYQYGSSYHPQVLVLVPIETVKDLKPNTSFMFCDVISSLTVQILVNQQLKKSVWEIWKRYFKIKATLRLFCIRTKNKYV